MPGAARARGWLVAGSLLAAGSPAAQPPTFRSSVEVVEVVVLVKDKDGRFVPGLRQADFEVLEQGVGQQVVAFEQVSLPVQPAPGAAVERAVSDVSTNEHAGSARVFVLLLDALHVDSRRTHEVRRLARAFVAQHVGPGDLVAVVSPAALPQATQDFTNDKSRLLLAIDAFTGTKLVSATVGIEEERRAAERGGVAVHQGYDPNDAERITRVRSLSDTLESLARHMARVERRRKALLLFSEGIDYNLADVMGRQTRYADEAVRANGRAVRSLMLANVAVYAVDPRRLSSVEGELVEGQSYGLPRGASLAPTLDQEYADSIGSLRRVSEETGGFAAIDRNDLAGDFARIVDESSRYYVLGYTPRKPMKPGEYREISVRVGLPGVSVVARKGHFAPSGSAARAASGLPDDTTPAAPALPFGGPQGRSRAGMPELPAPTATARRPTTNDLQSLLASPLPLAGLPMRVQAIPFPGDGKKGSIQLVVEVLGAGLQLAEKGGRFEDRIELALLTVDAKAKAGNGRTSNLDLRLTPEELARVKATGVRWLSRLDVAPGRYQVRVAGRSARSGATGLVTADVEVEQPATDRPSLSGVTLTSTTSVLMVTRGDPRASALATPPSATRRFVAGDGLTVSVLVSVPAGVPELELAALVEWPDGSRNPPILRKVAGAGAQARSEEVAIPIDTALLAPGPYLLRLALGTPKGTERLVPFDISAAARR
jgi:VWFA-related protein